jgi:hypothetical protein
MTIYIFPSGYIAREGMKKENTQYGSTYYNYRRGDTAGAAPACPFAPIDTIFFITMMNKA